MSTFSSIWKNEVKGLATACIGEKDLVRLMLKPGSYNPTIEEEEYLQNVSNKCKDPYGMIFIFCMICDVEINLAHGKEEEARMIVKDIYEFLNSDKYISAIFKDDSSSEEYKTRIALRDGLKKLI